MFCLKMTPILSTNKSFAEKTFFSFSFLFHHFYWNPFYSFINKMASYILNGRVVQIMYTKQSSARMSNFSHFQEFCNSLLIVFSVQWIICFSLFISFAMPLTFFDWMRVSVCDYLWSWQTYNTCIIKKENLMSTILKEIVFQWYR